MLLQPPSRRSGGAGLGSAGGVRRRAGASIVSLLAGLLLVGVLGDYAYQTRWPPQVDDRELARVGAPVSGARPVGGPYTVSGSVVCVNECVRRGQLYSASGSLTQLDGQLTRHLGQLGYAIKSGPSCIQEGPPVLASGQYELECTVIASTRKFQLSVTVQMHGSQPAVPLPAGFGGRYNVPGPPPDVTLQPGDRILVAVSF
jgi:hypothetical protein